MKALRLGISDNVMQSYYAILDSSLSFLRAIQLTTTSTTFICRWILKQGLRRNNNLNQHRWKTSLRWKFSWTFYFGLLLAPFTCLIRAQLQNYLMLHFVFSRPYKNLLFALLRYNYSNFLYKPKAIHFHESNSTCNLVPVSYSLPAPVFL